MTPNNEQEFHDWWNGDHLPPNPYPKDSPVFWAWAGWVMGVKAEREACAKVCEALGNDASIDEMEYLAFRKADEAIRSRGDEGGNMSEKPEAFQVAKQLTLRAIEELTEDNVRLRLENGRLRGLLAEAQKAVWMNYDGDLLDRIEAALKEVPRARGEENKS